MCVEEAKHLSAQGPNGRLSLGEEQEGLEGLMHAQPG